MSTQKDNIPRGVSLLHDPLRNKGTAFTEVERDALGLRGLLPPHIHTQDEQMARFLAFQKGSCQGRAVRRKNPFLSGRYLLFQ